MLVCAASVVARISVCATHAAGPFLPCLHHIAFALCLLMHLALLFALVYVPCMSGLAPLALSAACICVMLVGAACVIARISVRATHAAWPFLPCSHHIAFALCLLVQLALPFCINIRAVHVQFGDMSPGA